MASFLPCSSAGNRAGSGSSPPTRMDAECSQAASRVELKVMVKREADQVHRLTSGPTAAQHFRGPLGRVSDEFRLPGHCFLGEAFFGPGQGNCTHELII